MTTPPGTAPPAVAPPLWPHCAHPGGCRGRRVDPHPWCLAHLAPADRAAYLAGLAPGDDVDHQGTTLDPLLLEALLTAVRDPATGYPRLGAAEFGDAHFTGSARFGRAQFDGHASFRGARFTEHAWFRGAHFTRATFVGTSFDGGAEFDNASFTGSAEFGDAHFTGSAGFDVARFDGDAQFYDARFDGGAWFRGANFHSHALFGGAVFAGEARFNDAGFAHEAEFRGARFAGDARFDNARFDGAARLGPLVCRGELVLSGTVFGAPVIIEAAAARMTGVHTRWEATATLRLRYAALDLTDAVITQPFSVAAHPEPFTDTGAADALLLGSNADAIKVASLRGVDAAFVALTDTDLTGCRFAGALHLDQLRLEGRTVFAAPPTGTRWRNGLPRRWTPRRTLAEEHAWRALDQPPPDPAHPTPAEWRPGPDHPNRALTPGPDDLAPLYRALRKSFEDNKNEPGAADFYYGETTMRRHDRIDTSRAERALLTSYWALSGYGLRATRAFGWLLAAMTATVLAMMLWGLPTHDPKPHTTGTQVATGQRIDLTTDNPAPELHGPYGSRLTAARAEKAARVVVNSVVFRSSGQNLTTAGTYIEMASRFTEPTLLALAALALRSRVKR
ncbi:MAG: pentapeptide repeat-containing protein [Streptomycetaceae bacterium]|nr:pentapeptide repeat-containing protein [Streptomycetaceae bacterium]